MTWIHSSKPVSVLVLAAALGVATMGSAQEGPTVIRAARMLDVVAGRMLENVTVVVEGDRITAVNPSSTPRNAEVIDLGDRTLVPGFMDMHTHLIGQLGPDSFTRQVRDIQADAAFAAAKYARITLLAGFTTVRDFGGDVTVSLKHAVERGDIVGPRVVPSRNPLGITGGHCDVTGYSPGILEQGPKDGVADGPWQVVQAVRYQIKHGAEVIKTCATAGVLSFEGPVGAQQYSMEELVAMVEEAARHGVKVAAHAHGTEGIKAAVRAGVASIEHGSMLDDEAIELMKEHGTYLVPTTYLAETIDLDVLPPPVRRKAEQVLPLAIESVRRSFAAGVKIGFGTVVAVFPNVQNAGEFGDLVDRGMTALVAL
ncbi:MAG: amidohydrolase family protein, partial [Longimicrobiales bacterium]